MHPLEGKIIKSHERIVLSGRFVDGKVFYPGVIDVPEIHPGDVFRVKSVEGGVVILQNLNTREDWYECELMEEQIDNFTVVKSASHVV